jgi:hypothetical protein
MPAGEELFSEIRRRIFVGICTATYEAEREYPALTRAPEELATVRGWLCAADLGERAFKDAGLPVDPGLRSIEDQFTDSDGRSRFRDSHAVIVYATGHGVSRHDGGHRLILSSSDPEQLATTLQTARLVEWLKGTVRYALVLIDTCYAGQVVADLHAYGDLPPGWLVLTMAGKTATAGQKAFAQALDKYLSELRCAGSHGPVEPFLDAANFVRAIRENLVSAKLVDHGYVRPGPSPCLPNPVYDPAAEARVPTAAALQELALLQSDIDAHWGPRSRGVTGANAPGWFFTGRATILRRLVKFIVGPPGLLVVTGRAGCGKSAVLSRLVTFADPRFVGEHTALLAAVPPGEAPPLGSVDVAVVATGKRAEEVVEQIAGALGLGRMDRATDLAQALLARGEIATVVIDALDESPEPGRLAALVSDLGQTGVVRAVVGIRSSAGKDSEDPAPGPARALAIGWPRKEVAAIDGEPWWSDADLTAYARDLLIAGDGGPSPYRDNDTTGAVADRLARSAGRSFLLVRLTASSLARESAPYDPNAPQLADRIDRGVVGVVADEVRQVAPDALARRRLVDLLVATAFAAGAGLPWHGIWPHVANAVAAARGEPATVYGNNDVAELLGSRLGGYLGRTLWHDVTVYRPFHESLAEALRSSPGMLDGTDEPPPDAAEVHRRILAALLPLTRPARAELSVHAVPYYVRRHLVDHALAAGALADLLRDADALLTLRRGAAVLAASHTHDDMTLSALLLRLADMSADHVDERAAVAELRARQLSRPDLADLFAQRTTGFPWRATWADWAAQAPTLELWRDEARIDAVAAHEIGGSAYVAAGCNGWLIGFRSAWSQDRLDFRLYLGSAVTAIAITADDRGPLVAAGTDIGDIALIRPTQDSLRPVIRWRAHPDHVSALCFAQCGLGPARLTLLSAGRHPQPDDASNGPYGLVTSWDLDLQRNEAAPQTRWETLAFSAATYSLSVGAVDGEPTVFAVGDTFGHPPEWDRAVRLLRLADGSHLRDTGPEGPALYAAPVPGEPATIVCTSARGSVHLVTPVGVMDTLENLEVPLAVTVFRHEPGEVAAVVVTSLGLTVVPLAGRGDAIRFGSPRPPLRMTSVRSLATATDQGRPVVVIGQESGRVLLVEADQLLPQVTGPPDQTLPVPDLGPAPVHTVTEGPRRRTVVSAPGGGQLRLKDAFDGTLLHVSADKFVVSRWMTTTTLGNARTVILSTYGGVLMLDQELAPKAEHPLADSLRSYCAHPFTDGYRDFVAIGGQDEHVQVLDIDRGIVVALADRRRNSDKTVYALATAQVGLRRMLFAAGDSRDIVAYELPEQGLPSAGNPATLPRLWDEIQHEGSVSALAALPTDPPILASAGYDEYIRLTRLQPADPSARNDPWLARQLSFSPMPDIERPHGGYQVTALAVTGSLLLSGGADGVVRVWHVDAEGGHPVATVPLDAPVRNMVAIDGAVVIATYLGTVGIRLSHVDAQP